jgi:hypothetical protein
MRRSDMLSPFRRLAAPGAFKTAVKAYFDGIEGSIVLGPYDDPREANALVERINMGKVKGFAEAQLVTK